MTMDGTPSPAELTPDVIARRAASFGGQAAAYAAERPDYPDAAVRWFLEPVADRRPLRVLDLGAGTGKLTAGLLRRTDEVVAVEPDTDMLAELRRRMPGVRALAGTAERLPFGDASVDAVVAGQAIHWFDLDRALPEIARVLTPGGVFGGLWNIDDDRVPWVAGLKRTARNTVSFKRWDPDSAFDAGPHFERSEVEHFPHSHRRTAESMAATIGTHSHVLILDEAERTALMSQLLEYLRATPETASGEFDLPIVTATVRARLASA